jgi:hypothetical protein
MRDGSFGYRYLAHIFMRAFGRFAHGIGNCIGFANSDPDFAVVISSHNCDTELEPTATFDNLSDTSYLNDAFVILLF